ncbi:alpha/beta fold hydrolase [Massilia sp. CMS3.1]|uniref:S9 family peptidase n=1 Tax=Massilia sp. CMS3.1 TaxID=3373083 RepID=UPI003EE7E110
MFRHNAARRGAALLLLCAATSLHAAPDAAALPIERFFINPVIANAELSPTGRYLAAISGAAGRRDYLVVIDLQGKTAKLVAGYEDADILEFDWVNDERLVFNVTDKQVAQGGRFMAAGLYAVNRDGGNLRQLAERRGTALITEADSRISRKIQPWHTFMLRQHGDQKSGSIHVSSYQFDDSSGKLDTVNLLRLNTLSGAVQTVPRPGRVDDWMLDQNGEPRLASFSDKGVTTLHYRDPATSAWRVLTSFPTYKGGAGEYLPLGFGQDGTLYATADNGKDTSALYTVNLATGALNPEPVVSTPGYDFNGALVRSGERILGVRLRTDGEGIAWFDPAMQAAQKKLDAALPGMLNLMSFPSQAMSDWALVLSYSDVKPRTYHLFNLKTGEIDKVGDAFPNIDPARMGRQDLVRYKARDGMEIPALLTLPANGAKNAPLVVLVHGGPYVRGTQWGWNPATQFLASRGYAVLEPEYRGSTGYGNKHFRAGWKQWGLAMQDDIADGARWAVAQGYADPKRICIAGASYGGYATLMGLAKDPDLYKCGVSWAGVTDINVLYTDSWNFTSDLSDQWKQYGMPELIGDQVKDAAQLKATSPIQQVAQIKAPLLLAYGGADRRVPMAHGLSFREAIKPHNKQVEWIAYQEEGHGWGLPKNRVDFWSRVERFLDKHIGNGAQAKTQ